MTVRTLTIVIDDAKPLGPQLAGARLWGIPWKLLRELGGGCSVRHLQNLTACAHICERQAVRWEITVQPLSERAPQDEEALQCPG
jgi:hypothetical protein